MPGKRSLATCCNGHVSNTAFSLRPVTLAAQWVLAGQLERCIHAPANPPSVPALAGCPCSSLQLEIPRLPQALGAELCSRDILGDNARLGEAAVPSLTGDAT